MQREQKVKSEVKKRICKICGKGKSPDEFYCGETTTYGVTYIKYHTTCKECYKKPTGIDKISPRLINRIRELRSEGLSHRKIAEQIDKPYSTVSGWFRRFKDELEPSDSSDDDND